ncbi:hypothetical protein [Allomesorhizobium alhagi]|uniref:Uncharacterized protein n=1 Tax=Mesorhizobium alhagi CCNWXJ12-2 TaxID=1107882 RepID=H0HNI9_9HYPH|nr:hypothetical protein [Mesorhizobium alhagi]EHK57642.1 hypothetical protein MAXJ12_08559 [Mesorhizobium alhagi CCNWXJ12-2]
MAGTKHDEEDLEMLTDEEREGLLEDADDENGDDAGAGDGDDGDKGDDEADAGDGKKGDDDDAGGDDAGGDDADAAAKAKAAEEAKATADDATAAAAAKDKGEDAGDDDAEPEKPQQALPEWKAPADAKTKLDEIETKKDEIAQKFDDGELTAKEMRAALKPLDDERDQIKEQLLKAALSSESAIDTWKQRTVPDFIKSHPEYKPGTIRYRALDAEVRALQAEADGSGKLSAAILAKAHQKIVSELGEVPGSKKVEDRDKNKRRDLPPNLANVPAADLTETDDGSEFAYLDRLDGVEYEKALEKLSDEKREQYLAS